MKKLKLFILSYLLIFCFSPVFILHAEDNPAPEEIYIAIIIDDFGNHDKDVTDMLSRLSIPFTGAVIPGEPSSVLHMQQLNEHGKDVIIHIPMEAKNQKKGWNTPLSISTGLSTQQIQERVTTGIEELPLAVGVNNHMGSKATADKRVMTTVVDIANKNNLLVIDSLTSDKSKVTEVCDEKHLNHFVRDVFLDKNNVSVDFVQKRMNDTLVIAKEKGYAIAIGHVGPSGGKNTTQGILNMVEYFESEGVKFVTIDELHQIVHKGVLIKECCPLPNAVPTTS